MRIILVKRKTIRKSHRMCSLSTRVLRNFGKFLGKHLCQSLLFNEVAGLSLSLALYLKRASGTDVFLRNFKDIFLQNTSGRLLLNSSTFQLLHDSEMYMVFVVFLINY